MRSELRQTRFFSPDELWSPFAVCAVPLFVFKNGAPVLTKNEKGVYAVLCKEADNKENNCTVSFNLRDLQQETGYEKWSVIQALRGLRKKDFIRPVGERKQGSREALSFELTNPANREGFALVTDDKREFRNLRSALYHAQLGYMNIPLFGLRLITKQGVGRFLTFRAFARVANLVDYDLRQHEEKQHVVAGRYSRRNFEVPTAEVQKLSGLNYRTFTREREALNKSKVLSIEASANGRTLQVTLMAPGMKQTLEEFEEEQKRKDDEARLKRYEEANQDRKVTPAQSLALAIWFLKDLHPKIGNDGEFLFFCPECHNFKTKRGRREHKPRFSVNPFEGRDALFCCYDCDGGQSTGLARYVADKTGTRYMEVLAKLFNIQNEEPECYAAAQQLLGGFGGRKSEQPTAQERKTMKKQLAERQSAEAEAALYQPVDSRTKTAVGGIGDI
jgi:hypothetical protein